MGWCEHWRSGLRRGASITTLATCSILLVAACAKEPIEPDRGPWPALTGVRDLRASYRTAVCSRLPADAPPCDEILFRTSPEVPDGLTAPVADLARRYRIVFVPGFLNECLEGLARPFSDVEEALRVGGFRVDYLQVSGRGTSTANADRLARQLGALLPVDPRPVVVFAYSKGLLDVLELVVRHPEVTRPIAAVVGVAGAAYGSPLADTMDALYRRWFASLPLAGCERGTGEEIEDLQRHVRVGWWRRHGSAITVPLFSIVAAPNPDRVSPVVRAAYLTLSRTDPRNDGNLVWEDQIAPGGNLLGYVNADHLAIAVPVAHALPVMAPLFRDGVPRTALIGGAVEVIDRVLRTSATASRLGLPDPPRP